MVITVPLPIFIFIKGISSNLSLPMLQRVNIEPEIKLSVEPESTRNNPFTFSILPSTMLILFNCKDTLLLSFLLSLLPTYLHVSSLSSRLTGLVRQSDFSLTLAYPSWIVLTYSTVSIHVLFSYNNDM